MENIDPDASGRTDDLKYKTSILSIFYLNVENIGVEPMTSCLQSRRSSQLS